jgi:uncharacterized protein YraI
MFGLSACEIKTFCQPVELLAPLIVSGPKYGEIISSLRPSFSWQSANDCSISAYQFEIGNDQTGLIANPTGTAWTVSTDLDQATKYYWKVAAVAADGSIGPYSISYEFFTGPTCVADQSLEISLDSPKNGSVITSASPVLSWSYKNESCVPEKNSFTVQNQATGQTALRGDGGAYTSFQTSLDYLQDCQLYRWWVVPTLAGQPAQSYAFYTASFVTNFNNACPDSACDAATLSPPTLVSPADGAIWTNPSPSISWSFDNTFCRNNLRFLAEVGSDPGFSPGTFAYVELPGTSDLGFDFAAYALEDCTDYYWRVTTLLPDDQSTGETQASNTFSFFTNFTETCGKKSNSTINSDSFCRNGPGTLYPKTLYLGKGLEVELIGRSQDSSWLIMRRNDGKGSCWINASLVDTTILVTDLQAQSASPLPVQTIPTPQPTTEVCIKPPHPNPQDGCWIWFEEKCQWECWN